MERERSAEMALRFVILMIALAGCANLPTKGAVRAVRFASGNGEDGTLWSNHRVASSRANWQFWRDLPVGSFGQKLAARRPQVR